MSRAGGPAGGGLTPAPDGSGQGPVLALRPKDAAKALGIGERKLWELTADRTSGIPVVRFGKAVIYPIDDLRRWLSALVDGKERGRG